MGKVGGNRNYGYGKKLAWAGRNALADRYGEGHYSTRATHEERWKQFVSFLKQEGIHDARKIDRNVIRHYAKYLRTLVHSEEMKVAYAQNLLSTVNVVLETLRKDTVLTIRPAQQVGHRSNVRTSIPATLERTSLSNSMNQLNKNRQARVALVAELARTFGLRFREASLLNARQAIKDAERSGRINITQGTKGGRGKGSDRWVPVHDNHAIHLLKQAVEVQGKARNLIPENQSYSQWRDHAYYHWRTVTQDTDIHGFHDMRAAYACERYETITGSPAPAIAGERQADKTLDTQARVILSQELGHNRIDVIAAYCGK